MKIIKKKTRKAIEKSLRKAIKKHAPAIAAGLVSGLASSLATLAGTDASDGRGKSNLGKLAETVKEALGQQPGSDSRKARAENKARRPSESTPGMSPTTTDSSRLPA